MAAYDENRDEKFWTDITQGESEAITVFLARYASPDEIRAMRERHADHATVDGLLDLVQTIQNNEPDIRRKGN